ncbi:acid protease [Mycena amicta]|nr:acid protease [Mycena amicta]
MQLSLPFSTLLAGVLVALSANQVDAFPTAARPRMVTLPLKRIDQRSDAHPQIFLQQHMNRADKRLALMSGREAPTEGALYEALQKRVLQVEGEEGIQRRYNRWTGAKPNNSKRFKRQQLGGPDSAVGVAAANAPTAANSLGLNVEVPDVGYLATVQMGTPPRDFLILMDSGSADLWVASQICTSTNANNCGNHQILGSKSSSSFVASDTPFQITYGSGAVSGRLIQDDISIAGLSLKAHTFGVAITESDEFAKDSVPFDGLMGLAKSTLSNQRVPTPVEALASQGLISSAITSYKISRTSDNKNDGEITFGALDPSKFDPATLVTIDNVSKNGFWEGALDAVTVDGKDLGLAGRTAILDTGTTLCLLPQADAAAIHAAIPGSQDIGNGQFTVPCDFTESVALAFGGTSFAIDPRDIAIQPVDNAGNCFSGISGTTLGLGDNAFLVGDVFLKNAYLSTDVDRNQISLAKLV